MIEETSSSAALRRCRERAAIAREMSQDLIDSPTLKSSVAINAALLSSAPRKLAKRAQVPKVTVHRNGYQDILELCGKQQLPRIYRAPDDKGKLIHHMSSSTGSIAATKQKISVSQMALGLVKPRQPDESARRLRKPSASQLRSAPMKAPPQNQKVSLQGGSNTNESLQIPAPSKIPAPPAAAAAQAAKTNVDSYRRRRYTSAMNRNHPTQHQQ